MTIKEIVKQFNIDGNIIKIDVNNNGIINNTYIISLDNKEKYILQEIRNKDYNSVLIQNQNIMKVTNYIKEYLKNNNDIEHKTLEFIKTKDNKLLYICDNQKYYRVFKYIANSISYNSCNDKHIIYLIGKAYGNFIKILYNSNLNLEEVDNDFHNTLKIYDNLEKIIIEKNIRDLNNAIEEIRKRKNLYSLINDKLNNHQISYWIVHNDTKISNVLLKDDNSDYKAVIDLDTVAKKTFLYDYGDGIRSIFANSLFDEELFKSYTDGFLEEIYEHINKEEIKLMGKSILIITLELAMRFLIDYLNNNIYFKVNYREENLDKCHKYLKLAKIFENKMNYIENYIINKYNKLKLKR